MDQGNSVQESSYTRGYFDGVEDADDLRDSSPLVGMAIIAGLCSAFWFFVGYMIGSM